MCFAWVRKQCIIVLQVENSRNAIEKEREIELYILTLFQLLFRYEPGRAKKVYQTKVRSISKTKPRTEIGTLVFMQNIDYVTSMCFLQVETAEFTLTFYLIYLFPWKDIGICHCFCSHLKQCNCFVQVWFGLELNFNATKYFFKGFDIF